MPSGWGVAATAFFRKITAAVAAAESQKKWIFSPAAAVAQKQILDFWKFSTSRISFQECSCLISWQSVLYHHFLSFSFQKSVETKKILKRVIKIFQPPPPKAKRNSKIFSRRPHRLGRRLTPPHTRGVRSTGCDPRGGRVLFATRAVRAGAAASEKTRGSGGRGEMGVMGRGMKITCPAHLWCVEV